jgi:hypothetical protein
LLIVTLGAGTTIAVLSKLDLRVIMCSDGRAFRFDWEALRGILEQPRLHLLAER